MTMAVERPNILILFTDMQRADTVHALGNSVIRTPHLDRLAAEGTAFTNCLSPSPVCGFLPVRAFLLVTPNVPNPTSVTASLFLSAFVIAANVASTASSASFLLHVTFATSSINCPLFIATSLFRVLSDCLHRE